MSFRDREIILAEPPPRQNVPARARLQRVEMQGDPALVVFFVETDLGEVLTYEFFDPEATQYFQGVQNGAWVAQGMTYTEWVLNYLIANTNLAGGTVEDPAP